MPRKLEDLLAEVRSSRNENDNGISPVGCFCILILLAVVFIVVNAVLKP